MKLKKTTDVFFFVFVFLPENENHQFLLMEVKGDLAPEVGKQDETSPTSKKRPWIDRLEAVRNVVSSVASNARPVSSRVAVSFSFVYE